MGFESTENTVCGRPVPVWGALVLLAAMTLLTTWGAQQIGQTSPNPVVLLSAKVTQKTYFDVTAKLKPSTIKQPSTALQRPSNKVQLGSEEDLIAREAIYWRARRKAEAELAAGVDRTWEAYLANTAYYPCPLKERLGDVFDGGKWLCAIDALINAKPSCVVFSLGSAGEVGFELEVVQRMPKCRVVVFDPSLDEGKRSAVAVIPDVTLHEVAIAGTTTEQRAINDYTGTGHEVSTVDILGALRLESVTWVDVIKMDIETYEFEVLTAIFEQNIRLPCTLFLVELHLTPWEEGSTRDKTEKLLHFFKGMQDMGFRVYSEEPNYFAEGFTAASNIVEMAFINVDSNGLIRVAPDAALREL